MRKRPKHENRHIAIPSLFLDANALEPPDYDPAAEIARLRTWYDDGEVFLTSPKGVVLELSHENTPGSTRKNAPDIYTIDVGLSPREKVLKDAIVSLLRGNSISNKHEADADHLFEAQKYHATIFVTHDERMLRREAEIRETLKTNMFVRDLRQAISIVEALMKR